MRTPEQQKAYLRAYYLKNQEKIKARVRKYAEENRDEVLEKKRVWSRTRGVELQRKRRKENPEHARAVDNARYYKDREKRLAAQKVAREANPLKFKEKAAAGYRKHKEKRQLSSKAYRTKNAKALSDQRRKWREDHRDELLPKKREEYAANRKRYRDYDKKRYAADKSYFHERTKKWKKDHPLETKTMAIASSNKRRALQRKSQVGTDRKAYRQFVKSVKSADRITCYWCKRPVPKEKRQIDHIVSVISGGPDSVHNLCCSCTDCNLSKGSKKPEDFCGQQELQFA